MVPETEDPTGSLFIDRLIKNVKEMRANEDMFRLLIEHSHDIIYSITSDGMFTYVSPVWTQLLGHPVSEVLGKSYMNFVHHMMCLRASCGCKKLSKAGRGRRALSTA